MSLTAMARENALLERSTESNSAPSGTGIDLGDPAEYLSWHHDRSGTLGWERANEGCETPVVLHPSFACHTHKVVPHSNSTCIFFVFLFVHLLPPLLLPLLHRLKRNATCAGVIMK